MGQCQVLTLVSLCPGSWHHIQNLDSFFTKISFVPSMQREGHGGGLWSRAEWEKFLQEESIGLGIFLNKLATFTAIISGMALLVSCWRMSSS